MTKTRTTHVRRIKNADNEDVWIDVERVDKIVNKQEGQGGLYRLTTRIMEWGDEASEEPPPNRKTTQLRIEHPEDPDTFVEIYVIDKQQTRRGQGPDYKKTQKWFYNDKATNTARVVSFRRVYHWDTATDPNDDGGTEYIRIEDTEDRSQYIDVAVIEKLIQKRGQGPSYKLRTYQFNTDPIKEFSEPSPEDVDPADVVWLDPFQNIVNVQWKVVEFVAFSISLELIWEPTEEFVFYSTEPCSPNLGFWSHDDGEYNTTSTIHFIAGDGDTGAPVNSGAAYVNGEWVAGGGPITGLDYPFPKTVDLSAWQFVGVHSGFPTAPVIDLEFEEADGEIIVDHNGDPVTYFSEPYRRAESVDFNALGRAYLSGPACRTTEDFPIIPGLIGFPEDIVGLNLVTPIPEAVETISISSIMVEYQGKTFQGCGYYADGSFLHIICEKVTE